MAGSGNQRYLYWAVSWENKWQNTKTNFHGFVYLIRWFLNRYSYWGERQKFCVPFLERYVNAMIVRMPAHGITLPRGRTGHILLFLGQSSEHRIIQMSHALKKHHKLGDTNYPSIGNGAAKSLKTIWINLSMWLVFCIFFLFVANT